MSQENVEVQRRVLEAVNRGDKDAWLPLNDPGLEFCTDPGWPEASTVRGREHVWDFVMSLNEAWEPGDMHMTEVIDAPGDALVARYRRTVTGRTSGASNELDYWCVTTFREGKILRNDWFVDRDEALQAAGLPA